MISTYRLSSSVAVLLLSLFCHFSTAHAGTIEAAFSPTGGNNNAGFTQSSIFGYMFTPQVELEVTMLGVMDTSGSFGSGDGLAADMPVAIYLVNTPPVGFPTGTELERVDIPAGTTATLIDGFRYVDITPLTLLAGQRYEIASFYSSSGSEGIRAGAARNEHSLLGNVQAVAAQSNQLTDIRFTVSPFGSTAFGPNFRFIAIPEPASAALIAIAGLFWPRRRRHS